jgi:hypothetical protein
MTMRQTPIKNPAPLFMEFRSKLSHSLCIKQVSRHSSSLLHRPPYLVVASSIVIVHRCFVNCHTSSLPLPHQPNCDYSSEWFTSCPSADGCISDPPELAPWTLESLSGIPLREYVLCLIQHPPFIKGQPLRDKPSFLLRHLPHLTLPVVLAWQVMFASPAVSKTLREEFVPQSLLQEVSLMVRLPGVTDSGVMWPIKL